MGLDNTVSIIPPRSPIVLPHLPFHWDKGTLVVFMPCYNEEEALPIVLNEWCENLSPMNIHLYLINDGSKDSTLSVLQKWHKKFNHIGIIDKKNSGHGPSCIDSYKILAEMYDVVFQTDSDGQIKYHDFLQGLQIYSLSSSPFLIGKRYFRHDGLRRTIISIVLNYSITIIFGKKIPDANVPFRFFQSTELKPFLNLIPPHFFLANALLASLLELRSNVQWMPIPFYDRVGGMPSVKLGHFKVIGAKIFGDFYRFKKEHRFFFE